jgi:hypothetical protein
MMTLDSVVQVALVVGFFGFIGPLTIAWYTARQRRRERKEDKADREAVSRQAENVAVLLAENTKTTTPLLQEISDTGKATHQLVNNDRSIDKTYIAKLTKIVARLLPDDPDAQAAAHEAQADADRLPKPIDKA